jgi:hypothetical protein
MTFRLIRIQALTLAITTIATIAVLAAGGLRPVGVVLGGAAAWLDFVVIRGLVSLMLVRRPKPAEILPLAFAKSAVLLAVPALALIAPGSVVDGPSFALGVTALPAAVVIDALTPRLGSRKRGEA